MSNSKSAFTDFPLIFFLFRVNVYHYLRVYVRMILLESKILPCVAQAHVRTGSLCDKYHGKYIALYTRSDPKSNFGDDKSSETGAILKTLCLSASLR